MKPPARKPPGPDGQPRGVGKKAEARRRAVLEGIIEGIPEWKLQKAVCLEYGCSERTFRRDLQQLGERFRLEHDDPAHLERTVGCVLERLQRIAIDAEKEKKFHAAISANATLARLAGLRSDRWRTQGRPAGEGEEEAPDTREAVAALARARELEELSDDELAARRSSLVARLQVFEGGQAQGS